MEQTVFNPAQMKILQMLSYIKTPQELDNLENVLSLYFAKKVDEGIDELCDNGSITHWIINELLLIAKISYLFIQVVYAAWMNAYLPYNEFVFNRWGFVLFPSIID